MDGGGHLAYLAPTRVNLNLTMERWPEIRFRATREHRSSGHACGWPPAARPAYSPQP